ncbi:MAG: cation:dicarboxylase symporter family transporter [Pseudomonadota bacterium]
MSLSAQIFIGLAAGVFTGLFFGDLVAELKFIGDVFVQLLQITVLPYIMVSLIAGFGRMQMGQARSLAARATLVLLAIWGMALVIIFAAPLAFPSLDTASFFGSPVIHQPEQTDLLELYVPSNIFYSLSRNLVPAVVLFSILVGIGLISVKDKSHLLPVLDSISDALSRVNHLIVKLTPYGIFAIAAAAAGTLTIEEVGRVQVYLVTYITLALICTFWVFPGLVATLSGIPYRKVLGTFKDTLVTAFATGSQFVVLPQIAEQSKALLKEHKHVPDNGEQAVDIIVPVSFNFPSLGKLLVLLFVLFSAWFTDTYVSGGDRAGLAMAGLFSLFGSINVAVPYLLDRLQVPADMFQLFLITGIVVGRFGAMLAALHIIVVSLLGTMAVSGGLRLRPRAIFNYLAVTAALLVVSLLSLRFYFTAYVPASPPRDDVLANIELMEPRVEARVLERVPERVTTQLNGTRLDRVLDRGILRVGYRPANLPCSFITPAGQLVGFDVEMAHSLAEDLGVLLEFVPFDYEILGDMLNSGQIDIGMSCIASLPDRHTYASFSASYLDLTLAIIIKDHERDQYEDFAWVQRTDDLKIALISSHYFEPRLHRLFPKAELVYIESAEDFFTGNAEGADALIFTAEEGAAYTYRYPAYMVLLPGGNTVRLPAAYALPKGDVEMMQFVSNWVDLKRKEGSLDQLYNYWMLGGATERREPRWSIVRDVLGWID